MVHRAFGSEGSIEDMKMYFKGKITYEEWCRRDRERWERALGKTPTKEEIERIFQNIERYLNPYAKATIELSKRRALGVGLVSAGIEPSTRKVAEALNVGLWMANPIYGKCEPEVEPKNKLKALKRMLSKLDISLEETIYVGDSLIDLPALLGAGCGIGVGSEELKNYVDYWIPSLASFPEALLYCLNNPRSAKAYPYHEEYEYGDGEGNNFPWIRFLDLD